MSDLHFFILFLVSALLVRAIFTLTRTKPRLLPSPLALPIIGHLHLLGPLPHQALYKLSKRYGPLFHISLGSVPSVVVSSAETAKEFLRTHETVFSNRPLMSVINHLSYSSEHDFAFAEFGPYWKFMKKLCMSRLLGGQTLDQLLPIRCEERKRLLKLMLKRANGKEPVDLARELLKLTSNVVSRMLMSLRCSEDDHEADEVRTVVSETVEILGRFNLSDYILIFKNLDVQGIWKQSKEVHDKFDKMIEKVIKDRKLERFKGRGNNSVKDLLDILLDISEDESSEMKLTKVHIKAFILDVFVAGTDASSITIEWALSELLNHPNIMAKAREEIDSVVGKNRLVEESDIPNLPYIQAIIKETLRLHPAAPLVPRESSEKCMVNGYEIPARTRLFINIWAIGRDPNYWKDPLEFKPERFLSEEGSGKNQLDVRGQNFHFLPFGSGRRGCPGTSLALHVVQTNLASLIQCFEWKVNGRNDINNLDMEEAPGINVGRANSLVCVPMARLSPIPL